MTTNRYTLNKECRHTRKVPRIKKKFSVWNFVCVKCTRTRKSAFQSIVLVCSFILFDRLRIDMYAFDSWALSAHSFCAFSMNVAPYSTGVQQRLDKKTHSYTRTHTHCMLHTINWVVRWWSRYNVALTMCCVRIPPCEHTYTTHSSSHNYCCRCRKLFLLPCIWRSNVMYVDRSCFFFVSSPQT